MKQKLDEKARERPLCKRKVAGANPAESTKLFGKEFNQKALIKAGDKSASGSGCGYCY